MSGGLGEGVGRLSIASRPPHRLVAEHELITAGVGSVSSLPVDDGVPRSRMARHAPIHKDAATRSSALKLANPSFKVKLDGPIFVSDRKLARPNRKPNSPDVKLMEGSQTRS